MAAITFVVQDSAGSTNATSVTTGGVDTTGADFLVVAVASGNNGGTVTDSKSNTWTALTGQSGNDPAIQLFYSVPSSVGASHTISVSGASAPTVFLFAFSGVKQSSPFDQQNGATSTSTANLSSGSITPTENGELIIWAAATASSIATIANPLPFAAATPLYLVGGQHYTGVMAFYLQPTAAAISASYVSNVTSTRAAVAIASFKAASPSSGGSGGAWAFSG